MSGTNGHASVSAKLFWGVVAVAVPALAGSTWYKLNADDLARQLSSTQKQLVDAQKVVGSLPTELTMAAADKELTGARKNLSTCTAQLGRVAQIKNESLRQEIAALGRQQVEDENKLALLEQAQPPRIIPAGEAAGPVYLGATGDFLRKQIDSDFSDISALREKLTSVQIAN